jgi:hypothetical protein
MCNTEDDRKSTSPPAWELGASGSSPQRGPDPIIAIQVGERRFRTKTDTLQESGYLRALISPRWDNNKQEDGSYFIDADPELFEHILRYLRRGVLPIFYDKIKGHDHALYLALLEEAKYLQIPRLQKWLEEKRYLKAVTVSTTTRDEEVGIAGWTEQSDLSKEFEIYPLVYTKKVYLCPRRIDRHKGDPDSCGRQCRNAMPEDGPEYVEEACLKLVSIRKETVFDREACLEGRGELHDEE